MRVISQHHRPPPPPPTPDSVVINLTSLFHSITFTLQIHIVRELSRKNHLSVKSRFKWLVSVYEAITCRQKKDLIDFYFYFNYTLLPLKLTGL